MEQNVEFVYFVWYWIYQSNILYLFDGLTLYVEVNFETSL